MLLQTRKVAPHSCSPKLLPEAASKLVRKAVQSCSPKLFPGAAPQCYAPKLFSKAVAPKLQFCKPVHQNGPPKHSAKRLPKAAPQNSYWELLPKATVLQSNSSAKLFRKAGQSCFPKLYPKASLQSGCPKAAMLQTCFKPVPQGGSPKLFSKEAPESCSAKLLPKAAPQSFVLKLVHKAAPQSCSPKPLPKVIIESSSE